jgi:hypothetical protein
MTPKRQKPMILMKNPGAKIQKSIITIKLSGQKATVEARQTMPLPGENQNCNHG